MADNTPLDKLFKVGMTKEEFVKKYEELKAEAADKEDTESIFKSDLSGSIETMFDIVNSSTDTKDDKLDEVEISALKSLSDDNDNNEVVSESDLAELYTKTIKKIEDKYTSTDPKVIYAQASRTTPEAERRFGGSSACQNIEQQLELIGELIDARKDAHKSKLQRYNNQLSNLNFSAIDKNLRTSYSAKVNKIKSKEQEVESLNDKLEKKQKEMDRLKGEIEYVKEHKDINEPSVKSRLEELDAEYVNLSDQCSAITGEIANLKNDITALTREKDGILNSIQNNQQEFAQAKQAIQAKIAQENVSYANDIKNYQVRLDALETALEYTVKQDAVTYDKSDYSDEDVSNFKYDEASVKELQSKWIKKWTKDYGASKAQAKMNALGGEAFFKKVVSVASRLHCDANALMGVMNSESGIDPHSGMDKNGKWKGRAVGLIQFMPSTAKNLLHMSSQTIGSMSAIQQMDLVEKMIKESKKIGGIKQDQALDSATLYTLVFLPAYAKRDVLAVKGHKYYNYNAGLDRDGDNKITKADMARRVREKMA